MFMQRLWGVEETEVGWKLFESILSSINWIPQQFHDTSQLSFFIGVIEADEHLECPQNRMGEMKMRGKRYVSLYEYQYTYHPEGGTS